MTQNLSEESRKFIKLVEELIEDINHDFMKKLKIKNEGLYNACLEKKHKHLYENFKPLFEMAIDGGMDMLKLKTMLSFRDKVSKKEITQHDASVTVGKMLVDEYIKPNIKNENENK